MNRRDFLQSLGALGVALAVPVETLARAPESEIDRTWQHLLDSPAIFYVNEYGALTTDAVEYYPTTRAELLGFAPIANRKELVRLAADEWQVDSLLENHLADLTPEQNPEAFDTWQDWLAHADDETVAWLVREANDWINSSPNESDYERADIGGYSGRGQALRFFRDEFDDNDLFDIVIVEGDHPGSSYFAAELRMSIDRANALAAECEVPIRFAVQG